MIDIVDTHTHLYLEDFQGEEEAVVRRAIEAGATRMVFPNVSVGTIEPMRALASKFPRNISMAMGLHPTECGDAWRDDLAMVMDELQQHSDYVAVGEVGIDLYWDKTYENEQMQAFDLQVAEAEMRNLPIIIHCREGLDQTLEVLQGHPGAKAVFHSFGGTCADVDKIRRVGDYYFGINGIATFKNCKVRESVPEITLDRLLLETDAPYLAPVPYRGKRNESAYIVATAAHLADYLGVSLEEIAQRTTSNAFSFFNLQ